MHVKLLRRPDFLWRYPLLGLVLVCSAVALTHLPGAARAHYGCSLSPAQPNISGSYPNQSAQAFGVVFCDITYSGDIRLRGWTGSSWTVMDQVPISCSATPCGVQGFPGNWKLCGSYNYVDTFMYANFGGHGHTNNGSSSACNFP
jgi:hypothetical protein